MRSIARYIHELPSWPDFTWDETTLFRLLPAVRHRQGKVLGSMRALGFELQAEATLNVLTLDVLKSSEIEGVILDPAQVRSSVACRLGMDVAGLMPADRNVDGVVEMMLDATQKFDRPLTKTRLWGWHAAMFPTGFSGMFKIRVGAWRDDKHGRMQVVSGAIGRERVHFVAPAALLLNKEMARFLDWCNRKPVIDEVLMAALAHLRFVTIHPFDDGNGRIARALADMWLARSDGSTRRFYSLSAQIRQERKAYYDVLEKTQKAGMDITAWLEWFLYCLDRALLATQDTLKTTLDKARFWETHKAVPFNTRQRAMLGKLLDGFMGKLTSSKWAKIAKCSQDTALRDIQDLLDRGIMAQGTAGGRSTGYELKSPKP